jgi:cytochrome o ubiquinol oxidase subunit 2
MENTQRTRLSGAVSIALSAFFLSGCNMSVLDPKGQIGADEKTLIIVATLLMLLVVIPVIAMTLFFAWKYRASNTSATYAPNWSHSTKIEVVVWAVPCAIILALGIITWNTSHSLDPYKPLEPVAGASAVKPIEVEVVALDWKWLFIYPEQRIASVNELAFPAGTPVHFKITSDSVMNAFFIPQLGSQVYAMAGMQTHVNLVADTPGAYDGMSANFSGPGFSDMKFVAKVTSQADFDAWVKTAQVSKRALTFDAYNELAKPTEKTPVAYFSNVEPLLYATVLDKYMDKASGIRLADKLCLPKKQTVAQGSSKTSAATAVTE